MEVFDISVPLRPAMPVFPGDPTFKIERVFELDRDGGNGSRIDLGVHTGTHVDAALHVLANADAVECVDLNRLVGPAAVVDARSVGGNLTAEALSSLELPDAKRLLFRTTNSELWADDDFAESFVAFEEDGARLLVERGVETVGIDYLTIGDLAAHIAFLAAGVAVVEGLDLRGIEAGPYEFACLPVNLVGSDGAPARAILRR